MEIIDPNHHYTLATGTSDERAVPMAKKVTLGAQFDNTNKMLIQIHQAGMNHPSGAPQRFMIEGMWTLWCFVAHDLERMRTEIDELKQERDDIGDTVEALERTVSELKTKVDLNV